jgi:carnitine 3-dehydrogenase
MQKTEAGFPVAMVGFGTVGLGWTACYLAKGYAVRAFDTAPGTIAGAKDFLQDTWPALREIGIASDADIPFKQLQVFDSLAETVRGAAIIHENGPENADIKRGMLAEIEKHADKDAIIASSSGGLPPTLLQTEMKHPGRFVIAHPFNPPHLVPLVEVLGGQTTESSTVEKMMVHLRSIGKHPIKLDREMPAYLTNRLQFALLREAVHCLAECVASVESIEDAVRYGLAPRWMTMGALTTLTLAGGPGGMARVVDSFSEAIQSWWDALGTPRLDDTIKSRLLAAAGEIAQGKDLQQMIVARDKGLVEALRALAAIDRRAATSRGPS